MKNFLFKLLLFTIFLNIWIPKSGVKIKNIPLTIGNVAYLILCLFFILSFIYSNRVYKDKIQIFIIIFISIFMIRFMLALTNLYIKFNDIIQYLIPLCIFPFIYIIIYNCIKDEEQLNKVLNILTLGFIFICVYGLIQSIFGIDKVTIPGITVNYSDYKESPLWYLQKNNGQGDSSKLISTYQNGNVFGVNLLLIFPIVFENAKEKTKFILLILFLMVGLLTLSRSVWLAMGIYLLLRFVFNNDTKIKSVIFRFIIILTLMIGIPYAFNNSPQLQARVGQTTEDNVSTLSGRTPDAVNLFDSASNDIVSILIGPYGLIQFNGGGYEMTYVAIYMLSGLLGLLLFSMFIAISLYKLKKHIETNPVAKGCYYGMITYFFVAFVEGAFWLPPTALNLFTVFAIGAVSIRIEKNKQLKSMQNKYYRKYISF